MVRKLRRWRRVVHETPEDFLDVSDRVDDICERRARNSELIESHVTESGMLMKREEVAVVLEVEFVQTSFNRQVKSMPQEVAVGYWYLVILIWVLLLRDLALFQ